MLPVIQRQALRGAPSCVRGLATVAPAPQQPKKRPINEILARKVPVRADHGLYGFFRRKPNSKLSGEDAYETLQTPNDARTLREYSAGRPWMAAELRLKSFKDLHTLWYVCAREQNVLFTQREEYRRISGFPASQYNSEDVRRVHKTMARIKQVLNERRRAYEGAVKLVEKQHEAIEDQKVYQEMLREYKEQRETVRAERQQLVQKRRAMRTAARAAAKKAAAELARKEAEMQQTMVEQQQQSTVDVNIPQMVDQATPSSSETAATTAPPEAKEPIADPLAAEGPQAAPEKPSKSAPERDDALDAPGSALAGLLGRRGRSHR
ncbi:MRP-L47-domain-containing protein [Fistulina hepatica ATCC 64428]|uniref:Large ribosomal subunit protein uL29m n=1 Tax=Fistulina hepatica ATCC 64428 TaxID=1128425 RepID=A0A0D7A806_9AGAR|nr:MRP-L47-domain-containing protein [Fistulina hepatica ATCC 64428]